MKKSSEVEGGWMQYASNVAGAMGREVGVGEYSSIMDFYIKGVSWEVAASRMPLEAPNKPVAKSKRFT